MSFVEQRQTGVVRYELFDEFDCRPRPPVLVWAPQMKKIRPVRTQNSRGTRFSVLQKTLANNGHVFAWHARKCFRYISCDIRAIDEHRLAFSNPMRRRGIRGQTKSYVTTTHFFGILPFFDRLVLTRLHHPIIYSDHCQLIHQTLRLHRIEQSRLILRRRNRTNPQLYNFLQSTTCFKNSHKIQNNDKVPLPSARVIGGRLAECFFYCCRR